MLNIILNTIPDERPTDTLWAVPDSISKQAHFNTRFNRIIYSYHSPQYMEEEDKIYLPPKRYFIKESFYHYFLCHEISHSVRRKEIISYREAPYRDWHKPYAEEEVIADVVAVCLLQEWNKLDEEILSLSSRYLRIWMSRGGDNNNIMAEVNNTLGRLSC